MKNLIAMVAVVGASTASQAFADVCDDFGNSVMVESNSQTLSVDAGKELNVPIKIQIDAEAAKKWKRINMSAGLSSKVRRYGDHVYAGSN